MTMTAPFNLHGWIEENRHLLKPPVGNHMLWNQGLMIMVVGGPNQRSDFHVNPTEEMFYQIEGDIVLRIREKDQTRDIPIKQGEIFLLPAGIPHSPQRPANTVGLVIERKRPEKANDHVRWFCKKCGAAIHDVEFPLVDLGKQLNPVIEDYKSKQELRTCKACGTVND